jgi:hypothetical protein
MEKRRIRDKHPGYATLLFAPSPHVGKCTVPFSGDWETATPVTGGSGCRRGAGGFTTGTCGIGTGMGPRTWGGATGMPPSRFLRGRLAGPPAFFAGRSSLLLSDSVSEMSDKNMSYYNLYQRYIFKSLSFPVCTTVHTVLRTPPGFFLIRIRIQKLQTQVFI